MRGNDLQSKWSVLRMNRHIYDIGGAGDTLLQVTGDGHRVAGGGSLKLKGRPETGRMLRQIHSRVPGLGRRVSGSGVLVRVQVPGRANHPWLAAAEQGCSALPKAESRTQREVGNREDAAGISLLQVTGDGHRGIGHSGVGPSAIGHRLRIPAAGSRTAGA
jgi:hypothetical protein